MDTQSTFCATLVDEWARAGVTHAFVAPGSRSTPLALALVADPRLEVAVHHDERCAAFMALGSGLATGQPAVVLCTSGTAATHFHAAVVEAHHARVPLLVVTADRPPELRDVGAPQAIDQTRLFGPAVRWFFDPGPPEDAMRGSWRSLASRAILEAATGPVHLNLPFREPLVGSAGPLPEGDGHRRAASLAPAVPVSSSDRLLVVCGATWPAGATSAPVLLTPRAGADVPTGIAHADALLRIPAIAAELAPDQVVRIGGGPASKVVGQWLDSLDVPQSLFGPSFVDPGHRVTTYADALPSLPDVDPAYARRWLELDAAADAAIATVLADHPEPTEPGTARGLLAALPAGAHLVVASSMPIRDLEWFATPRADVTVHANRGANGIDGTMSTAIGVALATGAPTAVLLGDVAFLHDSNALIGAMHRGIDLTIVVLDNDGGGIFSFLPQAAALPPERFERLFGTPHGVRPEALAAAHGIPTTVITAAADLPASIQPTGAVKLVVVRTTRPANVALHDDLHAAIAQEVLNRR